MDIFGVICEFNPFHLGHARLLAQMHRRFPQAAALCLMSGLYVQRGQPAVYARPVRTRAALAAGADLVLELPVTVSLRSAEGFAAGAVEILDGLGAKALCFGAETGSLPPLMDTARVLLRPELPQALRPYLDAGLSFPAARARAACALGADPAVLRRPNDVLAVEYCKAILTQGSTMTPVVLDRPGDYHAATPEPDSPSATALRALISAGQDFSPHVPPESRPAYENAMPHTMAWGERAVLARLRSLEEAAFAALPGGTEGLWRKLRRACRQENTLTDILAAAKSKRYPRTRLERMVMCAFLGLSQETLAQPAPYVRVLGFTPRGRQALRELPKEGLSNLGRREKHPWQDLEDRCLALYGLFARETEAPVQQERVVLL